MDQFSADIREIRELLAVLIKKFVKRLELEKVKGNLIFRHLLCQIKREGGGKLKFPKSFVLNPSFIDPNTLASKDEFFKKPSSELSLVQEKAFSLTISYHIVSVSTMYMY